MEIIDNRSADSSSMGRKFYVNCQELLNKSTTGNTGEWLTNLQFLKEDELPPNKTSKMSHKALYKAIFHKKEAILKVGRIDDITNEWTIFKKLRATNIPGVLNVHCYFECNESFDLMKDNMPYICRGPGSQLKVLVLDIVKNGNLSDFKWKTNESLQSCVKQSLLTVLQAYLTFGFFHEDCQGRNFLVKSTTKKTREYNKDGQKNPFGYEGRHPLALNLV